MAAKGFFNAFADVWMHEGVRTPMVDYCGALGHISPTDLGIKAAREALKDRYDATALSQIVTLKDSIILTKDAIILRLSQQVIEGKALQRQIFWLNLERWALRFALVFVTYQWAKK